MTEHHPTYHQVDEQLAESQPASVLVEHQSGMISVGQVVGHSENGALAFLTNLNQESDGKGIPTKNLSAEKLSDEHQQYLAAQLAGTALRGSEVASQPPKSWDQWVKDHPLSQEEHTAIKQSVDKNIALTRMYGSTYFNTDSDKNK